LWLAAAALAPQSHADSGRLKLSRARKNFDESRRRRLRHESYVRDITYPAGYYPEISLAHLEFSLWCAGAPLRAAPAKKILELGCGQGFGLALLAAESKDDDCARQMRKQKIAIQEKYE
jgi:SAM-dependent methyltransferase